MLRNQVDEHKRTLDEDFNRDFIDGYLRRMNLEKDAEKSSFSGTTGLVYVASRSVHSA